MVRLITGFAVVAAMFAMTAETEAQRRTPLRNLIRSIGNGWGTGHHWRNPGHDPGYYHSWSGHGNWVQETDTIINGAQPNQPTPTPATEDASAGWLNQQHQPNSWNHQTSQPIQQQGIQHPRSRSVINDQNWNLKPYHSRTRSESAIQIDQGGVFQITPAQTPGSNTGWSGQTIQPYQNNQSTTPRK